MHSLLVFASALAVASAYPGKIVGGHPVDIMAVPYMLNMESNEVTNWSHRCGGIIVGDNVVLTAARCVSISVPATVRFRSGATRTQEGFLHHAKKIILHPDFINTENGTDYDVAVIVVKEIFEMSETTQPIAVSTTEPVTGEQGTVSGWGALKEGSFFPSVTLQSITVPIVNRITCQEQYSGVADISDMMICAGLPEGGKDICLGDAGGPLVVNGTVAGIASWGEGCARPGKSGVYANVAVVADWINQQIALARE